MYRTALFILVFSLSAHGFFVPEDITVTRPTESNGVYRTPIGSGSDYSGAPILIKEAEKEDRAPKSVFAESLKPRQGSLGLGGFRVLE